MTFEPDPDDTIDGPGPRFVGRTLTAVLPAPWRRDDVHPDVVALVALLSAGPWISARLEMDSPVSEPFATSVRANFDITIEPVDTSISRRDASSGGRPGLAFSGGVDSVAAADVMPEDTILYFNERLDPPGSGRTLYDKSAAVHACEALADAGRVVRRIPCDVEHLRGPVGVPVDYSNAVPAVLMADVDALDAIGWGTIAESAYRIGSRNFVEYSERSIFTVWRNVFAAAGLDFINPVAGVSEVGTSEIVRVSPSGHLAQSCIRGTPGEPCTRCWKCVRKSLLDASLTGNWPDHAWVVESMAAREPMKFLTHRPIKHEDVLTYAMSRYDGELDELRLLKARVRGDEIDVSWLKRHYPPALDLVPGKYRDDVRSKLEQYLAPMTAEDQEWFRRWSTEPVLEDSKYEALEMAFRYAVAVAVLEARTASMSERIDQLERRPAPVVGKASVARGPRASVPRSPWDRFKRTRAGRAAAQARRRLRSRD